MNSCAACKALCVAHCTLWRSLQIASQRKDRTLITVVQQTEFYCPPYYSFRTDLFPFVQCPFVPRQFPLNFVPLACRMLTLYICNLSHSRLGAAFDPKADPVRFEVNKVALVPSLLRHQYPFTFHLRMDACPHTHRRR